MWRRYENPPRGADVSLGGLELFGWPNAEKDRYAEEHRGGWATFMDRLARLLAERRRG